MLLDSCFSNLIRFNSEMPQKNKRRRLGSNNAIYLDKTLHFQKSLNIVFVFMQSKANSQFCLQITVYQILFTSRKMLVKSTNCKGNMMVFLQYPSQSSVYKLISQTQEMQSYYNIHLQEKSFGNFSTFPCHPLSSQKKRARLLFAPGQCFWENLVPQQKESYVKR